MTTPQSFGEHSRREAQCIPRRHAMQYGCIDQKSDGSGERSAGKSWTSASSAGGSRAFKNHKSGDGQVETQLLGHDDEPHT